MHTHSSDSNLASLGIKKRMREKRTISHFWGACSVVQAKIGGGGDVISTSGGHQGHPFSKSANDAKLERPTDSLTPFAPTFLHPCLYSPSAVGCWNLPASSAVPLPPPQQSCSVPPLLSPTPAEHMLLLDPQGVAKSRNKPHFLLGLSIRCIAMGCEGGRQISV